MLKSEGDAKPMQSPRRAGSRCRGITHPVYNVMMLCIADATLQTEIYTSMYMCMLPRPALHCVC